MFQHHIQDFFLFAGTFPRLVEPGRVYVDMAGRATAAAETGRLDRDAGVEQVFHHRHAVIGFHHVFLAFEIGNDYLSHYLFLIFLHVFSAR